MSIHCLLKTHYTKTYLALRSEWAKAKARAERWEEEVVLLCEEMRRTLAYCRWKAGWWIQQQISRALQLHEENPIREGMEAYAKQQAANELLIADTWEARWLPVRKQARPILQKVLGNILPEGLDVGEATGEIVVIDLGEDEEEDPVDNRIDYDYD